MIVKIRLLIITVWIILISSMSFIIDNAYASQCIDGIPLEENYKNYEYIFSGLAESIDHTNPIQVQFYVHQSWKGNVTGSMIVNTAFASDPVLGFQFEEGKHYLVFASNDFRIDHPTVTGCSPTKLLSESKDTILQLQQLTDFTHQLRMCTSDRTACFEHDNICDPAGWECADSETIFDIDSPLKQIKSGITIDEIKCKNGLVIVAKSINNSPACVKPETKAKLIERGWTDNITKHDVYFLTVNGGYDIPYSISGAILSSITADIDKSELVIKLDNSTDGGNLIITLPRTLIDRKIGNDDGDFVVMINNMTINFKETRDEFFRTLEIPFVKGIETISIASPHDVS